MNEGSERGCLYLVIIRLVEGTHTTLLLKPKVLLGEQLEQQLLLVNGREREEGFVPVCFRIRHTFRHACMSVLLLSLVVGPFIKYNGSWLSGGYFDYRCGER